MDSGDVDVPGVIGAYSEALQRLIERLVAQVAWNGVVAEQVEQGWLLPEVMAAHNSATTTLTMTQQLTEFERARFDMRVGVARALRSSGLSNPEIAEAFGVSRQLVHRILADDRDEAEP